MNNQILVSGKKQVVVVGLGRFGSSVAAALYNLGHDVLAMDLNSDRVQDIMGQVTHPVSGDGTNETVLKELGVPDYDAAVISVGSDVVSSVLTCVLLKTMGLDYIVARAHDSLHGNALERIGVDKIIHPEEEMGVRLAHNLFNPNLQEYMGLGPNYGFSRMSIPESFSNKTLKELGFSGPRGKYGLAVLAIKRGQEVTLNPDSDDILETGDVLVLAGKDDLLERLPL